MAELLQGSNLLSNGYRGVKRPGREADHSPPASAEVKHSCIYTSTPPYASMAQCLISYTQGLYLYLHFTAIELKDNVETNFYKMNQF
jgi:hypothetical protein